MGAVNFFRAHAVPNLCLIRAQVVWLVERIMAFLTTAARAFESSTSVVSKFASDKVRLYMFFKT